MSEFLDRLKQGIDKGVNVVSVKSKEMVEVSKIKNQVSVLKEQQESAFFILGEAVYQMYLQHGFNEEKIRTKCEMIALVGSQILEKEFDLKQLHVKAEEALGKSFCSSCDSVLSERATFCSKCGERIVELEKN